MSYIVSGESLVLGKAQGAHLTAEELAPYNIEALLESGAIQEATAKSTKKDEE